METDRITSSGKTFSFDKSGSFTGSFPSSRISSGSFDISVPASPIDNTPVPSIGSNFQSPSFITVEKMDPARKYSDSWERIDDSMIVGSPQNETLLSMSSDNQELYASVIVHKNEEDVFKEKKHHSYANINFQPLKPEVHSYANISVEHGAASIVPKPKSAPSSPKRQKKPIPIRRKQSEGGTQLTSSQELTSSIESNSSPPSKVKVPKKPLPPVKPARPSETSPLDDKTISTPPVVSTTPQRPILAVTDMLLPVLSKQTSPQFEKRERSKTTLESGSEKKQPMLPPLKPLRDMAKTTDNLPSLIESVSPQFKNIPSTHSALKLKLSEPVRTNVQTMRDPTGLQPRAAIEPVQNKVHVSIEPNRTKVPAVPHTADSTAQTGRNELMRKLSLRRQRLEEQLGAHKVPTLKPTMGYISETSSERNSIASTTSTEVVVKYNAREEPTNGTVKNSGTDSDSVVLRQQTDNKSLTKFGVIEDTEGGSFII